MTTSSATPTISAIISRLSSGSLEAFDYFSDAPISADSLVSRILSSWDLSFSFCPMVGVIVLEVSEDLDTGAAFQLLAS